MTPSDKCPVCGARSVDDIVALYECGKGGRADPCPHAEGMLFEARAEIARLESKLNESCGMMVLQTMETGKLRLALTGLAGLDPLDPAVTIESCVKRIEQRERNTKLVAVEEASKLIDKRIAEEVEPRIRHAADELGALRAEVDRLNAEANRLVLLAVKHGVPEKEIQSIIVGWNP
jgi:hypothetical protein